MCTFCTATTPQSGNLAVVVPVRAPQRCTTTPGSTSHGLWNFFQKDNTALMSHPCHQGGFLFSLAGRMRGAVFSEPLCFTGLPHPRSGERTQS